MLHKQRGMSRALCRPSASAGLCSVAFLLCQECTNPKHQVAVATKFCSVTPNIGEPSVRNLLHVTLLACTIFGWLVGFGKFAHPCAFVSKVWGFLINEDDFVIVIVVGAVSMLLRNVGPYLPHYTL